jgi:hypothetical protein
MAIVASGQISLIDLNDSKQLQLFIGSNQPKTQIFNPNSNSYTPNWTSSKPVLTPQLFLAGSSTDIIGDADSINWYESGSSTPITSGTNYTLATSGVKTLTINTNILASKNSQLFICEVKYTDPDTGFQITTKADFEFVKVTNGEKGDTGSTGAAAIIGVLSNETHTVPTDSAGNNGNYGGATTTLTIYQGASVSTGWTIVQTRSGVTVTEATSSATATVTAMSADSGYVEFTASKSGYADVVKRFTLTKNKQGIKGDTGNTGASATAYWMVASAGAIQKNISGVFNPTSITFTAKSKTGSSNPVDYAGRWIIADSTDGSTFTDRATSTGNEASKSYTPSGSVKAVRARLYLAGGTSTLIDEQIVPVVSDGATGATGKDSVVAVVWTPDGNTIKNGSGTLKAEVTLYKGPSEVTPTAFKWYIQDPSATPASGGDADGGNGWRLLTSSFTGYNTATLTIPASAIANVESFMCIATYGGLKYRDVCTVVDVSDPIVVTIIGVSTFKNGQGSTELEAKLYRNGEEIDTGGTGYTYTWALYNADNSLNSSFGTKTGKTVTVSASQVSARANLVCEVSPK